METIHFQDLQEEFLARVSRAVYCSLATVDRQNRPRSRILHPIWDFSPAGPLDGPIGWIISWPESHKARHLAHNPAVSLAYIADSQKPVYVDGSAAWVDVPEEKQRIWDLYKTTPPPLGFDPQPHYGSIDHPHFGLLRVNPWRVELGNLGGEAQVWRKPAV